LNDEEYGSDLIVKLIAELGIPFVALNPGASFRGLHDSLVNFEYPGKPELVLCLHEEVAIAIAHGYARVTSKPLVAAVHNVVGLLHASMGIFNAWCDRVPMIVVGGTGPMATESRRNWIEWVHTAQVQGNLVRDFVKWDDQPFSISGLTDSLLRGYRTTMTEPCAPVYLCFDAGLQEQKLAESDPLPALTAFEPPRPPGASAQAIEEAADMLAGADWPVILVEGLGRHREALPVLHAIAELLQAPVVSTGTWFNIPSKHPLNFSDRRRDVLARADIVLMLDVHDPASAMQQGRTLDGGALIPEGARRIHISLWDLLQHSWVTDWGRLYPIELAITADTREALPALLDATGQSLRRDQTSEKRVQHRSSVLADMRVSPLPETGRGAGNEITMAAISGTLAQLVREAGVPWSFVSGHQIGGPWEYGDWELTEPDNLAGGSRGAGVGQSPASAVGAALAYRGTGRLCMNLIGDGDLLYTPTSLWTAANLGLPLLTVVNNNRSYGNDERHQSLVASHRGRPLENSGIGVFIEDPDIGFVDIAKGFGVEGIGPVREPSELRDALSRAVTMVTKEQRPVLVDVETRPRS
jgi:thiamine pyrophosphate-dependent acetolactate synthase large subunit-like protein